MDKKHMFWIRLINSIDVIGGHANGITVPITIRPAFISDIRTGVLIVNTNARESV